MLAGDLVAHWQAQDLVATTADGQSVVDWNDAIGGIVARADGTPRLLHTALGGRAAIDFQPSDGADFFVIGNLVSPMRNAGDFTLAVVMSTQSNQLVGQSDQWFKNTAIIDAYSLGFANDYGISMNANGQVSVGVGGGLAGETTTLTSDQPGDNDGQTHLVIFRREGNRLTLQIDDREPLIATNVSTGRIGTLDMTIGNRQHGDAPFEGMLGEIRVYNGALDAAEVETLYEAFVSTYDNRVPTATADEYSMAEDTLVFFVDSDQGVLANDVDPESDPLTAMLIDPPMHGALALKSDGGFVYSPNNNFFGTDQFTYAAVDFRPSLPTTVTLQVTPVRDGPTGVEDAYKTEPTQILQVSMEQGVLANDRNPDAVPLSAVLDQDVSQGQLTLNPDGSFIYDPQGVAGTVTFSYRVDDGVASSDPVSVTLQVNTPPSPMPDAYSVDEDRLLSVGTANGVLRNDRDADGDSLTAELVDEPMHGTFSLTAEGVFLYSPDDNYFGDDRFTYRVTDGVDVSDPVSVDLTINSVNDLPQAAPDSYFTLPNTTLHIDVARGLLANDQDIDGPTLEAVLAEPTQHGTISLDADGAFTYVPAPGYLGPDFFRYVLEDGLGSSAPTVVELTVSDRPVVINEVMATNANALTTRVRESAEDRFAGDRLTPDWLELKNFVGQPLDLTGMYLTDDPTDLDKWSFPAGTLIPANGYLVVFASGRDVRGPELDERGYLHTNFKIDADGDFLAITAGSDQVIHAWEDGFPPQLADVSYGLIDEDYRFFSPSSPGSENVGGLLGALEAPEFSVERGYFDSSFELTVSAPSIDATIVYTTDGTSPSMTNGTQVVPDGPAQAAVAHFTIDQTTTLRVVSIRDGYLSSTIATQTYFFPDDMVNQSNLWSVVTDNPVWGPQLRDSLTALPSISLVMDGSISTSRETPTSVEMIFPDGTVGFQINAGVEYYGGHSINSPKKNMRLSFKPEYGESRLAYDLFGEGATTDFDQILLRTGSHDNWFWTHPGGGRGNYVRNRWAFDRQLEMGHLAPHGRWVQVFINGEYWGLHHMMERPDASFMASYLGGEPDDYDALNAGTPIDGDAEAWQMLQRDAVIDDYEQVQQYLDVVNYADYMLLQFYAGNDWDWNHTQNWAAARKREPGAGYIFFSWDSDVMLRTTAQANVVARGGPGNLWNVRGGMRQHDEFLMLMADRAHRFLFNDGMLTNERLRQDVGELADEIRLAIIAETARWGRFGFEGLRYTPDVWEGALDWMLDLYAPEGRNGRTETTLSQLRRAGVYPDIDAPEYTVDGVRQHGGAVEDGGQIGIVAVAGETYYTIDGTDPRLPGGSLHPDALRYNGQPLVLDTTAIVKARTRVNDEWSALSEAEFRVNTIPADEHTLRISEVHYHPADPSDEEAAMGFADADEFEFIELTNISSRTIDLSESRLVRVTNGITDQGVDFDFSTSDLRLLRPGARLVVVENLAAFTARYGEGLPVAGQWSGGLGNAEEQITLTANGMVLQQFTYTDDWYNATDGDGYSLEVVDVHQDPSLWSSIEGWQVSLRIGGTPGEASGNDVVVGDANRDGVFNSADLVLVFQAGQYEDELVGNSAWEQGDWNGDGEFTTSDLVLAFQAGTYVTGAASGAKLRPEITDSLFDREDDWPVIKSTEVAAAGTQEDPFRRVRRDDASRRARDIILAEW